MVCMQDCVVLVAPQPYNPDPVESFEFKFRTDMDLSSNCLLWYTRPQLFFVVHQASAIPQLSVQCAPLAPFVIPGSTRKLKELALVFFSTFEPITLNTNAVTQAQWNAHVL